MPAEPLAHIDSSGRGHRLSEHLGAVSTLAGQFAKGIGSQPWGELAGLWHDLGKYRVGFQRYLHQSADVDSHIEGRVGGAEKTHSAAGALWAIRTLADRHGAPGALVGRVFAYLIASHHAGLYDWHGGLDQRLADPSSATEFEEALAAAVPPEILESRDFHPDRLRQIPGGSGGFALWLRMLFSCLVDADFLDTEAFFDSVLPATRSGFPPIEAIAKVFDDYVDAKTRNAPATTVNALRASVLEQCRSSAALPPGVFSLTVPTGGGKTLSSLAFALKHALTWGHRRIIYAIPFTTIIEQTADVFREALQAIGSDVLIEHHSQAESEPGQETARSRLACENWDAPLIVTTNVQLFESLFAARTSRCRKLHNLIDSVIVLDEAQQLPPEFLQPILDVLNLLVKHYGVTVVLCTATQPALSSTEYFDATRNLRGLSGVREIVDDPDSLFEKLKRVSVTLPKSWQTRRTWPDIAAEISQEDCILAIVNTRKAARELHRHMPPGTLHLSALMCGAHRAAVISEIKARLAAKRSANDQAPLRVVSTQLVEAGVDLDFPVVWRAVAGLDSIGQAAGRCNREGRLEGGGRVVVFVPPEAPPPGLLRKGADACVSVLHGEDTDPLARHLFEKYFRQLYRAVDLDSHGIAPLLKVDPTTLAVQFRSAADAFRMIDDEDSAPIIVRYGPGGQQRDVLLATLASQGPQRWLMRQFQRHMVTIRKRDAERLLMRGDVTTPVPGLYVQNTDTLYHPDLGLLIDDAAVNPAALIV